jgi:5-methylthioadenosine/S-adenosylhomocysteine deaminase
MATLSSVNLMTRDLDRLVRYYGELFGFEELREAATPTFRPLRAGNALLALPEPPVPSPADNASKTDKPAAGNTPRRVDTLITGATLVTLDAQRQIIVDGTIAIDGGRIAAVGKRRELEALFTSTTTIDGRRFVVTPGFVNAHIHVTGEPLTRGFVPDDTGFEENVWRWLIPLYHAHTPEDERLSAQLAAVEMLRSGTTTFLEAGTILNLESVVEGLLESGIRGRVGQWAQDRAFNPGEDQTALTDRAIRTLESELMRYPPSGGQRIAAWPSLIGHSTNTDALWKAAKQLADANGAGITAHMSPAEIDPKWFLENTGRRPIEHLASLGVLGTNVSLTHCVHLSSAEVDLLAQTGTNVTHCPMSALKGAYGAGAVGRFPEMASAGINLTLGTDGNNNSNSSDLMRAMYLVAALFKDARRDPRLFPAHEALTMATLNGAKALGLIHEIGSLEVGKKADLVLHDTERAEWTPLHNVVNQLVWSADGRGVHSVWVDGRRVVDSYRCTMVDESKLFADARQAGAAIVARCGLPSICPWPAS